MVTNTKANDTVDTVVEIEMIGFDVEWEAFQATPALALASA